MKIKLTLLGRFILTHENKADPFVGENTADPDAFAMARSIWGRANRADPATMTSSDLNAHGAHTMRVMCSSESTLQRSTTKNTHGFSQRLNPC